MPEKLRKFDRLAPSLDGLTLAEAAEKYGVAVRSLEVLIYTQGGGAIFVRDGIVQVDSQAWREVCGVSGHRVNKAVRNSPVGQWKERAKGDLTAGAPGRTTVPAGEEVFNFGSERGSRGLLWLLGRLFVVSKQSKREFVKEVLTKGKIRGRQI